MMKKILVGIVRVMCAVSFLLYTVFLARGLFVRSKIERLCVAALLIISLFTALLFKGLDSKIKEKNKLLYTLFGFACLGFQVLCGSIFVLLCIIGSYDQDLRSLFFMSGFSYCSFYSFLFVSLFLWAIKRIRFRWAVASLLWIALSFFVISGGILFLMID